MVGQSTSCRWLNPLETHLGQIRAHRQTHRSPRTGLLSSMKSSRHSGNSVHCPRSASSTKRLIISPIESRENHNSVTAFSHSQGQNSDPMDPKCDFRLAPESRLNSNIAPCPFRANSRNIRSVQKRAYRRRGPLTPGIPANCRV